MTPTLAPLPFEDGIQAWVPHGRFTLPATANGPLNGLRFAAKDLFDVAGVPTGAGNPHWLASHPVPTRHSPVVAQLLAAGATLCGKTITDELAYSIHGDNLHYGMPRNSAAPERIPGGSSSGSVAAVAAKLVDFALGTDTGGSTRVPASYCGVWGIRSTHGLLSREGLVPLHPRFDTATWFAHEANSFERVGQALLPATDFKPHRAIALTDAWALADADFQPALQRVFQCAGELLGAQDECAITAEGGLEQWRQTYVTVGGFEGWQVHGDWITREQPVFAPAIAARWQHAASITATQAATAETHAQAIRQQVRAALGDDAIAILPSAASLAPLRTAGGAEIDDIRARTLRICCVAGLAGLPQVSIPLANAQGVPLGVSLLGPTGSDLALIRLAIRISEKLKG
ncbi:MAG: amidase [Candidatus Dactylopiibacterium carminicum]|uniref:Amidase n=1 Tax=Candidatus Dactylopiibacterium carminicum TaxID=857335 RepID=A0A272EQ70_9RHOO|nr:amidase [Candidatus Dactylopiibacterium carminicum]KAF7598514.1 amidase [Candidatus Dactylopiibacterium carminicum]PAS92253.1 MAG: amidase [Candidatus Dactylopiibacterium carminicum]PAS95769.1 MAG: amidase [Candidatus Dactylopiibacterium carminicum]PAS98001.1 MAG: amidase [Candidatus Dactylopiibacterium carminicum]